MKTIDYKIYSFLYPIRAAICIECDTRALWRRNCFYSVMWLFERKKYFDWM